MPMWFAVAETLMAAAAETRVWWLLQLFFNKPLSACTTFPTERGRQGWEAALEETFASGELQATPWWYQLARLQELPGRQTSDNLAARTMIKGQQRNALLQLRNSEKEQNFPSAQLLQQISAFHTISRGRVDHVITGNHRCSVAALGGGGWARDKWQCKDHTDKGTAGSGELDPSEKDLSLVDSSVSLQSRWDTGAQGLIPTQQECVILSLAQPEMLLIFLQLLPASQECTKANPKIKSSWLLFPFD